MSSECKKYATYEISKYSLNEKCLRLCTTYRVLFIFLLLFLKIGFSVLNNNSDWVKPLKQMWNTKIQNIVWIKYRKCTEQTIVWIKHFTSSSVCLYNSISSFKCFESRATNSITDDFTQTEKHFIFKPILLAPSSFMFAANT